MPTDLFEKAPLEIEDLFLLEAFQIGYLPGWIPEREFAEVLFAHPSIERFLRKKCPQVETFVDRLKREFRASVDSHELKNFEKRVLAAISDLLVYNLYPEIYDSAEFHAWDFGEVTSIARLDGKVVLDCGAGTGRVALEAAKSAHRVFAIEPVARLREFIREKAARLELSNLFVVDGFLHSIPFPDGFADVLITSPALGWRLQEELKEFERVVGQGGYIIHCPGTADKQSEDDTHTVLVSPEWGYRLSKYEESDGWKRKYWKRLE